MGGLGTAVGGASSGEVEDLVATRSSIRTGRQDASDGAYAQHPPPSTNAVEETRAGSAAHHLRLYDRPCVPGGRGARPCRSVAEAASAHEQAAGCQDGRRNTAASCASDEVGAAGLGRVVRLVRVARRWNGGHLRRWLRHFSRRGASGGARDACSPTDPPDGGRVLGTGDLRPRSGYDAHRQSQCDNYTEPWAGPSCRAHGGPNGGSESCVHGGDSGGVQRGVVRGHDPKRPISTEHRRSLYFNVREGLPA